MLPLRSRYYERIGFVRQAQANGLTLAEIRELITLKQRGGARRCRQVQQLLAAKIAQLDEQRAELDGFRRTLQGLGDQCEEIAPHGTRSRVPGDREDMRHTEKIAPVAAALSALATLTCCLPIAVAAGTASATLAMVAGSYRWSFIGASALLLAIGAAQLVQARRACRPRGNTSVAILALSAAVVLLVVLFPQVVAGLIADWLP